MKRFYLYNKKTEQRELLHVEISPTIAETLDESLDNMTIKVLYNKDKKPLTPRLYEVHLFEVDDEDNETLIVKLMISGDNVQLIGTNPNRYEHTVSLIQRSQDLTKNLIRNNVFSTSIEYQRDVFSYSVAGMVKMLYSDHFQYFHVSALTASIDLSKVNISEFKIKVNFFSQDLYNSRAYITDVGTNFADTKVTYNFEYLAEYKEYNTWKEIFKDLNTPVKDNLPTLIFEINSVQKRLTVSSDVVTNNQYIELPAEIMDWLLANSTETLNISIDDTTLVPAVVDLTGGAPTMGYPSLIDINYEFVFHQIEGKKVYEVIDELLVQYQKNTKAYHDAPLLFKMPTSTHNAALYNLLKETNSPNFVFTQSSMFDALAEIFKLFDATFRIDDDGYLDIEYFNEHDKIELPNTEKAGYSSSLGEERFANRLVSYFQNTKVNDKFPNSNDINANAYLRSKTVGVPERSDFVFMLPKPIDFITSVKIHVKNAFVSNDYVVEVKIPYIRNGLVYHFSYSGQKGEGVFDITDYVIEESLWSILDPTTNLEINKIKKINSFVYKRGNNYISISDYYKTAADVEQAVLANVLKCAASRIYGGNLSGNIEIDTPNWRDVKLYVEYIALTDGKIVNESIDNKYEGELLTNQNNGSIDINKLGLNMVGLSLKLGQPTLTMTQKFTNWADRIKKGQFFMDGNDKWVANVCTYTLITNDIIQATIEFVKNFNGLASRIELNREKRLTNISNELTVKCEDNYGEFVYYGDKISRSDIYTYIEEIAFKSRFLKNSIAMTFGYVLPTVTLNEYYDATNDVVTPISIDEFVQNSYETNQLVFLRGYLKFPEDTDLLNKGCIMIAANSDFSGQNVNIPLSTTRGGVGVIYYDELDDSFAYDEELADEYPFSTTTPSDSFAEGDLIDLYVIVDGQRIIGGVIIADSEHPFSPIYFSLSSIKIKAIENSDKVEYALITSFNSKGGIIKNDTTGEVRNIAIPMVVYGSGNSVCFEMSFDSPISAGMQLLDNYTSDYWSDSGWFSRHVLYTDSGGNASTFTIDFVKMNEPLSRQFPAMKSDDGQRYLDFYSFGKIEEYGYYKKPNEIFALNYQIHFMPYVSSKNKQSFLSNEFIKNNGFANGLNEKILHIVYTTTDDDDDFEYSILDTKGHGTHETAITGIRDFQLGSNDCLHLIFDTALTTAERLKIKTWAIVDHENNIYYASNNGQDVIFEILFFTRHHRLD